MRRVLIHKIFQRRGDECDLSILGTNLISVFSRYCAFLKSTCARLAIGLFKNKKFCHWNGSIWAIADFISPPPPLRSEPLIHPLPIAVEPCGESFTFLWWWWPTPINTVPIPTLGWRKIAKNFRTSFAPQYCASNSATRYTVSALKSASASCQKVIHNNLIV